MSPVTQSRLEITLRVAITVLLFVEVITQFLAQPYLYDPAGIGTDPSTYYAAGLRLNAGHPLYGPLQPTDRAVPLVPPYFSVPLLSPPTIAVIWRALALLPGTVAMLSWWGLAGVLMIAITLWMIWMGSRLQVRLILGMLALYPVIALVTGWTTTWVSVFPGIPDSAVSGNVNGYLVVLLASVWWASVTRRQVLSGTAAALATALKALPLLLLPWLIATRQFRAAMAYVCAGAAILLLTVVLAGWNNTVAYLGVVGQTGAGGATEISLPGIARHLGAPALITGALIPLVILAAVAAPFVLRDHPGLSFGFVIVAVVLGSPVVHQGTYALLLAALTPLTPSLPWPRIKLAATDESERGWLAGTGHAEAVET